MVSAIPHASEFTAATRRYFPTADGLGWLAEAEKTGLDELLRQRPVSAHWQRILLERLDAVAVIYRVAAAAVIYRVAAALSEASAPLDFFWYRSGPADAGVILPDGRTLAVVRQGHTTDRAVFARRLWRLTQDARPSAALILVPDRVRLRQAQRMLDFLPLTAFLSLEGDAARADNQCSHLARPGRRHRPGSGRTAGMRATRRRVTRPDYRRKRRPAARRSFISLG